MWNSIIGFVKNEWATTWIENDSREIVLIISPAYQKRSLQPGETYGWITVSGQATDVILGDGRTKSAYTSTENQTVKVSSLFGMAPAPQIQSVQHSWNQLYVCLHGTPNFTRTSQTKKASEKASQLNANAKAEVSAGIGKASAEFQVAFQNWASGSDYTSTAIVIDAKTPAPVYVYEATVRITFKDGSSEMASGGIVITNKSLI